MKIQTIQVTLEGLAPLLFDRFKDHSKEVRPPEQKLYLTTGNVVVMPSENIRSFLLCQGKPVGVIKKFEKVKCADYLATAEGHIDISPMYPALLRDGKPVVFDASKKLGEDGVFDIFSIPTVTTGGNGSRIHQEPQPRPMLPLPWTLEFTVGLVENSLIDIVKLENWFERGGLLVGLGNYRPRFGRFMVKSWKAQK